MSYQHTPNTVREHQHQSNRRKTHAIFGESEYECLNQGNEPTFVVCNNEKVTDLTLGTNKIGNLVSNWQASNEPSSSDHRYISYQMGYQVTSREPMRTNWESYTEILKVNMETISRSICTIKETAATGHHPVLLPNCPAKTTCSPTTAP
jgi:hypothetical protein